jgi:hypothetical protein
VDRIIGTLFNQELLDAGLSAALNDRLYYNVCLASGISPSDDKPRKPFVMPHQPTIGPLPCPAIGPRVITKIHLADRKKAMATSAARSDFSAIASMPRRQRCPSSFAP